MHLLWDALPPERGHVPVILLTLTLPTHPSGSSASETDISRN